MAVLPSVPLSEIELILSLILTVLAGASTFIFATWYWSLDRKTENYDENLRKEIEQDEEFSGIRQAAEPEFIATSPNAASKFISLAKKGIGQARGKPSIFVPVDGDDYNQRKVQMIRERVRDIPGRSILGKELVGTLRNHYALRLALSRDDVNSETVEYFQDNLETYRYSQQVIDLAKPEHYDDVVLIRDGDAENRKDALNDIYLPLVSAAERYCVKPQPGPGEQHEELERCRKVLMPTFFGLWAKLVVGIEVHRDHSTEKCLSEYREDIRDSENWGYWMIPAVTCDDSEFKRLRHLAWRIDEILEEHWEDDPYHKLHPLGESLKEMEQVQEPFVIFQKEEHVVRGGASEG